MKSKLERIIDNDLVSEMYHVKSVEWLRHYYFTKGSHMFDIVEAQTDILYFIEDVFENPDYILNYLDSNASLHLEELVKKLADVRKLYNFSNSLTYVLERVEDKRLSDMFIKKQIQEERKYYEKARRNRKILVLKMDEVKKLIKKTIESYDR